MDDDKTLDPFSADSGDDYAMGEAGAQAKQFQNK